MAAKTQTEDERGDTAGNSRDERNGADLSAEERNFAEATLAEFGDSWKRPKDFPDEVRVIDVTPERCERRIVREMTATESRETRRVPPTAFEAYENERIPSENRYDAARSDFLDETVEYVCDPTSVDTCGNCTGDGHVACHNCSTGEVRCGVCGGDGMEQCSNCRGWGSKGPAGRITCPDCNGDGGKGYGEDRATCASCNGSGHVMCNSCSGGGEHRCTNCGGGGIVTCGTCGGSTRVICSTCEGETELVTVDVGEIVFETETYETGVSETNVPERFITGATGTKFKTDEEETDVSELDTETRIRKSTERRHVDVTRIDYTYGDEKWSVYDVDGRIRAESYPKSGTRGAVPYVVLAAVIVLISYGTYQYLF